jgi:hypothetical protein
MSRPWLFTLTLVLLAGVTALVFWPDGTAEAPKQGGPSSLETHRSPSEIAKAETDDLPAPSIKTAPQNLRVPAARTPAATHQPTSILPAYTGVDGVTVLVLDDSTDQPVALADVYTLDPIELEKDGVSIFGGTQNMSAVFQSHGKHYRCNDLGEVLIPPQPESAFLYAEAAQRAQMQFAQSEKEGRIVIRVRTKLPLQVLVVDGTGQPVANVPVALREISESYNFRKALGTTDKKGLMSWSDLNDILSGQQAENKLIASLEIPLDPEADTADQRIDLTPEILAAGKATLTMPPVGGVRVTIVDSRGNQFWEPGTVRISAVSKHKKLRMDTDISQQTKDGVAEFPFVGLDLPINLYFHRHNGRSQDHAQVHGPLREGEWVEATLAHLERPVLQGVILGPDGKPLAEQVVSISLLEVSKSGGSGSSGSNMKLDAQGGFQFEITRPFQAEKTRSRSLVLTHNLESYGSCKATIDLSFELSPGTRDLGEITLNPEAVLLAGRILDAQGMAISKVNILVKAIQPKNSPPRRMSVGYPQAARDSSDSKGEFRVQGELPDAPTYQVEISAQGYQTLTREISLGSSGMEFFLNQAGILHGTLWVAKGINPNKLKLRLIDDQREIGVSLKEQKDPTYLDFRFEGKADTPYLLEIKTKMSELVYRSDPIYLQPGAVSKPVEFQPLDLRSSMQLITILARNSAGANLEPLVWIAKEGGGWTGERGGPEGAQLLIIEPIPKLHVQVDGHVGQLLENVQSNQTVTLVESMKITLQIPDNLVHYRETTLSLAAFPVDRDRSIPFSSSSKVSDFDHSGRATQFANQAGEYEYYLSIYMGQNRRRSNKGMKLGRYSITGSDQVINLKIDQAELDRLIDEMSE